MSTAPIRNLEPEPGGGGAASIGKSVTIKGQIFSREDLTIEGEIEGAIELNDRCLTVGPNGRVRAGIQARDVVILGQIDGNIEALDKIQIGKQAKLVGDLKTARIIIEDGAYFKGSIDIVKAHTPKLAQPKPQVAAEAVPFSLGVTPVALNTRSNGPI